MGLFSGLFGGKEIQLFAPIKGQVVDITEVSDPTFGEKILGDGIAIKPTGTEVVAPCDATVEFVFETGHAVSMKTDSGVEILIHVGLDTVELKGEHFHIHVENGAVVKKGQILITIDKDAIVAKGYDVITPMVICNTGDFKEINTYVGKEVNPGDLVMGIVK